MMEEPNHKEIFFNPISRFLREREIEKKYGLGTLHKWKIDRDSWMKKNAIGKYAIIDLLENLPHRIGWYLFGKRKFEQLSRKSPKEQKDENDKESYFTKLTQNFNDNLTTFKNNLQSNYATIEERLKKINLKDKFNSQYSNLKENLTFTFPRFNYEQFIPSKDDLPSRNNLIKIGSLALLIGGIGYCSKETKYSNQEIKPIEIIENDSVVKIKKETDTLEKDTTNQKLEKIIEREVIDENKININYDFTYDQFLSAARQKGLTGILKLIEPNAKPNYQKDGNISMLAEIAGIDLHKEDKELERNLGFKINGINDLLTIDQAKEIYNFIKNSNKENNLTYQYGGSNLNQFDYQDIAKQFNNSNNKTKTIDNIAEKYFITTEQAKEAVVDSREYADVNYINYNKSIANNIDTKIKANTLINYLTKTNKNTLDILREKNDINASNIYSFIEDTFEDQNINGILKKYATNGKLRKTKLNEETTKRIISELQYLT